MSTPYIGINELNGHVVINVLDIINGDGQVAPAVTANLDTRLTYDTTSTTEPLIPGGWQDVPSTTGSIGVGCSGISPAGIALKAGLYTVAASASFYQTNGAAIRLYDATGAATLLRGSAAYSPPAGASSTSVLAGQIALSVDSEVKLQYYSELGGSLGRGSMLPPGDLNQFINLRIFQLAAI